MDTNNTTSALQTLKLGSTEREERLQPYLVERLWDQPAVYCGTYKKYNNGSLDGAWLDLEAFDSYEEFLEICALLHDDEDDPEFMFQDYQGFPREWYCESCPGEDTFNKILKYCELDENERLVFDAYYENTGDDSVTNAQDRYIGKYDSEEDFAEMYVNECYNLDHMMGDLSIYFDYEGYARYLFSSEYTFCDGYVFAQQ